MKRAACLLIMILATISLGSTAKADIVLSVPNGTFETPYLATDGGVCLYSDGQTADSWTWAGAFRRAIIQALSYQYAAPVGSTYGAYEGRNAGLLRPSTKTGDNGSTDGTATSSFVTLGSDVYLLQSAGDILSLSVAIARRTDTTSGSGYPIPTSDQVSYQIRILVDGLAKASATRPVRDMTAGWELLTTDYAVTAADVGKSVQVQLGFTIGNLTNYSYPGTFDDVRMSVTPYVVVPEPATLAFLAIGGLGMAGATIRRRRRSA